MAQDPHAQPGNQYESFDIPPIPVLAAGRGYGVICTPDGEALHLSGAALENYVLHNRPLLCHRLNAAARLKCAPFPAVDILELFAFVHPATFIAPTAAGLAEFLELPAPRTLQDQALLLIDAARILIGQLLRQPRRDTLVRIIWGMVRGHWAWAPVLLRAMNAPLEPPHSSAAAAGLRVWDRLPEVPEFVPDQHPASQPVSVQHVRARLAQLVGDGAEDRPQQADYASAVTHAFQPREDAENPHVVLAEAGTGVGKTLGYIAPASVWAEQNDGTVWLSTYTRNLQKQLDEELSRLHPDKTTKHRNVVVRKGRENYVCVLNFEDLTRRAQSNGMDAIAAGIMARWIMATRDGDMIGGDFPGWLAGVLGRAATIGLTDRRGECIYAACPHYNRCFIERAVRRAKKARIVVANHALVMIQAGMGQDESQLPTRYVFDEGHHLFDAADSAFAAHLSGLETRELRRWLLGAEDTRRSRARGLKARAEEAVMGDETIRDTLEEVLRQASVLPASGWKERLEAGDPQGATEHFLLALSAQVAARAEGQSYLAQETDVFPPTPELEHAAATLEVELGRLHAPLKKLVQLWDAKLDAEADRMESSDRNRLEGLIKSIERRALLLLEAWQDMVGSIVAGPEPDDMAAPAPDAAKQSVATQMGAAKPKFVDWLSTEYRDGDMLDLGMHRHYVDPMKPFGKVFRRVSHGMVITSATLRDNSGNPDRDWQAAERRSGGVYITNSPLRAAVPSPFDYANQTHVFVVDDVDIENPDRLAAAYRVLFEAAHGGALGLFTAISRLQAVHDRIAAPMDALGLDLLAQHVDGLDPTTLVEMFKAEENACLLGTDAMRDGVDVPGHSLRLVVFDRIPWSRPTILHKARRAAFGGWGYDDMLVRLKLRQAFGRLVRRGSDSGVFVLLDKRFNRKMHGAFPHGTPIEKGGLADAVALVRARVPQHSQPVHKAARGDHSPFAPDLLGPSLFDDPINGPLPETVRRDDSANGDAFDDPFDDPFDAGRLF